MKVDIVITHVNFNDIYWQNEYKKYFKEFNYNRHRAEINLKYLFRSINDNIDFVNNIYLILFSESQVYDWINKDKVKIIYHKDIIPQEFIPVFNSCAIEMFIHNIPNLSENFIYFNDDTFIINKKVIEDYYKCGKSNFGISEYYKVFKNSITQNQYVNDLNMIQQLTNKIYSKDVKFLHCLHVPIMYFKSDYKYVYEQLKDEIHSRITKERDVKNNSQFLFMDYIILANKWYADVETYKHHKYMWINSKKTLNELKKVLFSDNIKDLCVNHVDEEFIPQVNQLFEQKFPNKSIYEI